MNKQFLDYVYKSKHRAEGEREELIKKSKGPQSMCCKKMGTSNHYHEQARLKQDEINSIDQIITQYLLIHSK